MRRRQAACAAAPKWRTIPYAGTQKNQFHMFLDLSLQVTEVLEEADSIQRLENRISPSPARETICHLIEHIRNLKKWEEEAQISLFNGPPDTLGNIIITLPQMQDRTALRGYPSKIPKHTPVTFDGVQSARLMHLYWSVLLTLYMTILDNPAICSELETLQRSLGLDESTQPTTVDLIQKEAGQLADNIAYYSEFCCQNMWQSFGPMVSVFSLETAIRWYQNHGSRPSQMGSSGPSKYLEHCRGLLGSIRMQSEERQMFDDCQTATFVDIDVLRLPWCSSPASTR